MTALALIGNRDRLLNIPSLEEFLTSDHKRQNEIYYNDSRKPKPEEVLAILPIIKQFSSSLSIPTNWPNSMDGVKAAEFSLEKGSSELYIKITNGYCYSYDAQAKRVTGFVRNDCFFFADNRQHLDLKSITGAPRLNEQMAIAMVTNAIAKLGLGPNGFMGQNPVITRPHIRGKITVPRIELYWQETHDNWLSKVADVEVDLRTGDIISIYTLK